jgi:hypothetical protein
MCRRGTAAYDLGMSPMRPAVTARVPGLALTVGAVVALVMPWLVATATDGPSLVVLTAVALAALTGLAGSAATRAVLSHAPTRTPAEAEGGVLVAGRVTDTPHHPLRPRAPGVV